MKCLINNNFVLGNQKQCYFPRLDSILFSYVYVLVTVLGLVQLLSLLFIPDNLFLLTKYCIREKLNVKKLKVIFKKL